MAYRRSPSPSSDDSNDCNDAGNRAGIANVFRNDGSFLEMFKKMQNASQQKDPSDNAVAKTNANSSAPKTDSRAQDSTTSKPAQPPPVPLVGRRRGMKVLPVGKVKKLKTGDEDSGTSTKKDAWAKYLEEVKKYKETYCDGESKVRSLVK